MRLLDRPKRLTVGYWLGAMSTAVTLGLVIVFALKGSGFEHSSKKTTHPAIVLTLARILLVVGTAFEREFRAYERAAARRHQRGKPGQAGR